MKPITYQQALTRMAAYCSKAERCRADVRKKLTAMEVSKIDINKIIKHLEQERFLDEARYAKAFVHDKSQYNNWGVHKIKYELKRKDLPDTLINNSLQTLDSKETLSRLQEIIRNKRKTLKGDNEFEIRNKLIRFALGRGFAYEDIEKTLKL